MPIDHPFRTDPVLGPPIVGEVEAPAWYDGQQITEASYQVGTRVQASDGNTYVWTDNGDGTFSHVAEGGGGDGGGDGGGED